ncbi:hypothetical protein [uncultured Gimesia sp.]|uniref:hypothetical protein n=1 Tax=uncultured Gimesia sp. TaxID=1678688 RepID=UPI0030DB0F7D|tara:strand:- start:4783 stop:5145 length:363 start_codon:yes stop_codon:yes gene_type:complete
MEVAQILYLIGLLLGIVIDSVALVLVISWPSVKGKLWLVATLLCILMYSLLAVGFQMLMEYIQKNQMGPEAYEHLWIVTLFMSCLALLGKILFVITVFQLRGALKSLVSPFFINHEEGGN